jgi:hypothetical protein
MVFQVRKIVMYTETAFIEGGNAAGRSPTAAGVVVVMFNALAWESLRGRPEAIDQGALLRARSFDG